MAYTPELSKESSCTLRRIAWALGMPMTKTSESLMGLLPYFLDARKVCAKCRDKTKCKECAFKHFESENLAKCKGILKKSKIK